MLNFPNSASVTMNPSQTDGMPAPTPGPAPISPQLNPMVSSNPVAGNPNMQTLDRKPLAMQIVSAPEDEGKDSEGNVSWKISGFREHDGIYVFIDAYDASILDNHELKKRAYDYRLLIGMGNAGIEPQGSHYSLNDNETPPALLPTVGADGKPRKVWRRLFKLNSPI